MAATLQLIGRSVNKNVEIQIGVTILQHALEHKVDFQNLCTRGTCARCRCLIEEGREHLADATIAEHKRLDPEELEEGYRLGCQTVVAQVGTIVARNKTYF